MLRKHKKAPPTDPPAWQGAYVPGGARADDESEAEAGEHHAAGAHHDAASGDHAALTEHDAPVIIEHSPSADGGAGNGHADHVDHETASFTLSGDVAATASRDALLEVRGLRVGYGSLPVLYGIDLSVNEGETAVVLGLNGAGKTTTVLTLAGVMRPWAGTIHYGGEDVTKAATEAMVARGVVLVPEGRRVFPNLPVEENLRVGAWVKRRDKDFIDHQLERCYRYFPRLQERRTQIAGTLSGGEQQMLAISRGLMADPKLLMIDEASLGLAPVIVQQVLQVVREINEDGVTVILNEQNVGSLRVADKAFVMQKGVLVYAGPAEDLRGSKEMRREFLGVG